MPKRVYTPEQIHWLKDRCDGKTSRGQIAEEFNRHFGTDFSYGQIISCMENNKIRSGHKGGGKRNVWTDEQIEWLRNRVDGEAGRERLTEELNEHFGTAFTVDQVCACMKNNRIRCGVDTRFAKGHISANKGVPVSEERRAKMSATMFKTNSTPHNTDAIGTEKNVGGYIWVKTDDVLRPGNKRVNWTPKHILVWEEANGRKVPDGHSVIFLNGDRYDIRPDNLALVTRAEAARYRGIAGPSAERFRNDDIGKIHVTIAKIDDAVSRRQRSEE